MMVNLLQFIKNTSEHLQMQQKSLKANKRNFKKWYLQLIFLSNFPQKQGCLDRWYTTIHQTYKKILAEKALSLEDLGA